ncbi:hypothetical protein [Variovorax sp. 278MFTsu5.1]|uniref:hypothetical protein n=1 Tax=Variovorax sp. 278MFTsu5.1 TaxID=3158366 RepID=UPI003AABAFBE
MSIRRAPRPNANFYVLDKSISEDRALSWAARGMLIFLLGKPDNWTVSVANLVNETAASARPSGRDAVYGVIGELKTAGYLRAETARADGGTFGGTDYTVCECRSPLTEKPEAANPDTAKPYAGRPHTVNPTQTRTDFKQGLNPEQGLKSSGRRIAYTEEFEHAWSVYPRRPGDSKADAFKAWNARLKEGATAAEMAAGAGRYAAFCTTQRTDPRYIKQAATFFGPGLHYASEWTAFAYVKTPERQSRGEQRANFMQEMTNFGEADAGRDDRTFDAEARVVGG